MASALSAFIAVFISAQFAAAGTVISAKNTAVLDRHIEFIFKEGDEFHALCRQLLTACGEERLPTETVVDIHDKDYGLRLENVTVREVLNKIAERHPGFRWEISEGALTFAPLESGTLNPLDRPIPSFNQRGRTLPSIIYAVSQTAGLSPSLLLEVVIGGAPQDWWVSQSKLIDVSMTDTTARRILNTAVAEHGRGIWIYTRTPPARKYAEFLFPFLKSGLLDGHAY